jgi:hypothetical protein
MTKKPSIYLDQHEYSLKIHDLSTGYFVGSYPLTITRSRRAVDEIPVPPEARSIERRIRDKAKYPRRGDIVISSYHGVVGEFQHFTREVRGRIKTIIGIATSTQIVICQWADTLDVFDYELKVTYLTTKSIPYGPVRYEG